MEKMRAFIGLEPSPQTKISIANWRERAYPQLRGEIPIENLHLTLCFLGNIDEQQLEEITQLDSIATYLQLNSQEVGYFAKPAIGFLAVELTSQLAQLQAQLVKQISSLMRLRKQSQFVPHISFCRDVDSPLPAPAVAPDFQFEMDAYHLYESLPGKGRVHYRIIHTWNRI
ncbi:RNA 2',3'-cyclic phosphodiesterase [Planctobacterium marinum]|uniref:RNA 2',3'-cyclic phosphodiesterase n=1 Tax=Planctobacterium marinum TaxID=1631968 RepID=A0AA48HIJ6_9ALTE|nr:RNA 2',3'-cyclic phosphodiesterase [Planctobacterium marinum]